VLLHLRRVHDVSVPLTLRNLIQMLAQRGGLFGCSLAKTASSSAKSCDRTHFRETSHFTRRYQAFKPYGLLSGPDATHNGRRDAADTNER